MIPNRPVPEEVFSEDNDRDVPFVCSVYRYPVCEDVEGRRQRSGFTDYVFCLRFLSCVPVRIVIAAQKFTHVE